MVRFGLVIHQFHYETQPLKMFLESSPQYGANERGIERTSLTEPRYVRITDIDQYGRFKEGLGATARKVDSRYVLENKDLLIARSGNTVGKAYLHELRNLTAPHFFAGYLIRFRINQKAILPKFVFICTQLPYYDHWIEATKRPTGQPNINAEEYRSLPIPAPPMHIQKLVTRLYSDALDKLANKENQAASLLASIDDYLLSALGIELPDGPENTIENRIFKANIGDLRGWRFDPHALSPIRTDAIAAISSKYHVKKLTEVVIFKRELVKSLEGDLPYVGLGNVESETGRWIETTEKESISSAFKFSRGDILFPKLRPYLNKVFIAPFDGYCSTEFHVLHSSIWSNEFVALILRSKITVRQTKQLMSGNTLPRLQTQDIESLPIPVIELTEQQRLVSHVADIQQKAEKLFQQARSVIEQAKKKVEEILLKGGKE